MSHSQHPITHRHKIEAAEDFLTADMLLQMLQQITLKVTGFSKTHFHMRYINKLELQNK
jgi:hypothetical protein